MNYIRVRWLHSFSNEPVWLISEIDEYGRELRKVEIFPDGSKGYARKGEEAGGTRLGEKPLLPLETIAADPQFLPEEITKEEFEKVWANRGKK